MKKHKLIFYLIATLLVYSCIGDDDIDNTPKLGLLNSVEGYFNGEIDQITEISYDENHRLTSLKQLQGNFATLTYDVTYLEEEVTSIMVAYHWHPQHTDTTIVINYDITYQNNEITLSDQNSENKKVFQVTDGYVDSYKVYYGDNNDHINESVFKRDQYNNIDSISYYATNLIDTHLLVWKYRYSNFDTSTKLNSAYNPVFNYAYSMYEPFIGAVLNLKISNETPLTSTPINVSYPGSVTAEMVTDENGLLKKFYYEYFGSPTNDLYLELVYY